MGSQIALAALLAGYEKVIINDVSMERLLKAENHIKTLAESKEVIKLNPNKEEPLKILERLEKEPDLVKAVETADFIIEAATEVMSIKQELFKKLGEYTPSHAILATNTSTMSITEVGKYSGKDENVVGMHFFIPIRMTLIEVTKGAKTSDETVKITAKVGESLPCVRGKRLVAYLQKEGPGFIVNRISIPTNMYFNWVIEHSREYNIPPESIDKDMEPFLPIGPCEIWDLIGLDVIYHTMKYFEEVVSPEFKPGPTLTKCVEEGTIGRKKGRGFYEWTEKGKVCDDACEKAGLIKLELVNAIQLNEACRILEEGIVSGYKIIDDAVSAGMGSPGPFITGKRKYKEYSQLLEQFCKESGFTYFMPCELMKSGEFLKMRK